MGACTITDGNRIVIHGARTVIHRDHTAFHCHFLYAKIHLLYIPFLGLFWTFEHIFSPYRNVWDIGTDFFLIQKIFSATLDIFNSNFSIQKPAPNFWIYKHMNFSIQKICTADSGLLGYFWHEFLYIENVHAIHQLVGIFLT